MTGQAWRISVYLAMLAYGETEATPEQVSAIANSFFPTTEYKAHPDEARAELAGTRKLLAFVREPCERRGARSPSVLALLRAGTLWRGGTNNYGPELKAIRAMLASGDVRQAVADRVAQ